MAADRLKRIERLETAIGADLPVVFLGTRAEYEALLKECGEKCRPLPPGKHDDPLVVIMSG